MDLPKVQLTQISILGVHPRVHLTFSEGNIRGAGSSDPANERYCLSGVILAKNPPLRVDSVLNEGGVLWVLGQIWPKFSPPAARFPFGNHHLEGPKCQNFPPAAGFPI